VTRNESERISTCYKKNHAQLKEWRNRIKNSPEDFPLLFKGNSSAVLFDFIRFNCFSF